jgi:DNA-binding NarL/FixJ family response regulator
MRFLDANKTATSQYLRPPHPPPVPILKVLELRAQGMTVRVIAEALGLSKSRVALMVKDHITQLNKGSNPPNIADQGRRVAV